MYGYTDAVNFLLEDGADVNDEDNNGKIHNVFISSHFTKR